MSGCGCGTTTAKKNTGQHSGYIDDHDVDFEGTLFGGASALFGNLKDKRLPVAGVKVPNILQFLENPCLKTGDSLIVSDTSLVSCFDNFQECLKVTATPTLVGSNWEVVTNGVWTSLDGQPVKEFKSFSAIPGCGTETQKTLEIGVCKAPLVAADFKGYVYTRPINSPSVVGAITFANGGTTISAKERNFVPRKGDKVILDGTNITTTNFATVLNVTYVTNTDGVRVAVAELDKAVTATTVAPLASGGYCTRAQADPQAIATLDFIPSCGCKMMVSLASSKTNSPRWPMGNMVDGDCPGQQYCYTIVNSNPTTDHPFISGKITLR